MEVDHAVPVHKAAPDGVAIATLNATDSPAPEVASRYSSNSKDAYRERKRLKEIENARLEKIRQQEEAARVRAEVLAEKELRAGSTHPPTGHVDPSDTSTSSSTQSHPQSSHPGAHMAVDKPVHIDADVHAAEIRAFEERKRQKEAEEERKKKAADALERDRIKKEIEEERARKFGAAADTPVLTAAEKKAAYDEKQKEKQKEAWKLEQEANQRRLAELRAQLKEDKERKAALRAATAAASSSTSTSAASPTTTTSSSSSASYNTSTQSSSSAAHQHTASPTVSEPTIGVSSSEITSGDGLSSKSVAEQLAEARRARLGITKVTGTQAHAGSANYFAGLHDDDEDDEHLTIDQIKARNKARAGATAAPARPPAAHTHETHPPASAADPQPATMDSLRDLQQRRYEEQKKKEKEEEERRLRADRAARMLANTSSLATPSTSTTSPTSTSQSSSHPHSTADIPLETSSPDIPEEPTIISIRLPDGRIKRAGFKSSDPISAVHRYAASWLPLDSIFSLLIPVPRQEFNEENNHVTLQEVGLCPRGTLTVLTLQNRGTVRQAPPRPAHLERIMNMMNYEGNEMEATEELSNMSYEELLQLQERMGYVPTGLTNREITELPSSKYVPSEDGAFCVICQVDIEEGETIVSLPKCSHKFHKSCVEQWLKDHRSCPACRARIHIGSRVEGATADAPDTSSDEE